MDGSSFIPYGRQSIDEQDIAAVAEVLRGDYLTTGPAVDAFEVEFARVTGARFAVACANGTAGLHLCAMALGLGHGDVVIVPSVTFLATANAMRITGAEVVFADVDPLTGLMTLETFNRALIKAKQRGTPKAVLPVHLCGRSVENMAGLKAIADQEKISVIEDACHALGGVYTRGNETVKIGSCVDSDLVCFSAHPVKTIAMGEGGIVTTNNADLYAKLTRFRGHGLTRNPAEWQHKDEGFGPNGEPHPWYYEMQDLGLNYRISDIQCALGLSQLSKLDEFVARRHAIGEFYDRAFAGLSAYLSVPAPSPNCVAGWHLYAVKIDFEDLNKSRDLIMLELKELGIGTQVHYYPVHRQPYYRERYGLTDLPGADQYAANTLSLPLYPAMTDDDVIRVINAVKKVMQPS